MCDVFSGLAVSDSLQPHGLQHARLLGPSLSPRVCSNSCILNWWCHALSHPLSSLSIPAFRLSQHQGPFQWVGHSHQVAKVLEIQHQSFPWIFRIHFHHDWQVWFPCHIRDSQDSSPALSKASQLWHPAFFVVQLSPPYLTTGKTIGLTIATLVSKVISLLSKCCKCLS